MRSTRQAARWMLERTLMMAGVERMARSAHRGRTLVLAYHNVMPDDERPWGERTLHLPRRVFAAQLDTLAATHDVVALSEIDDVRNGRRPRAIITFDDAYRGALTLGLPELAQRGMCATVFVAPGLCGTPSWWDRVAETRGGALPVDLRNAFLDDGRGRPDNVTRVDGAAGMSPPAWATIASEDEIRAAVRNGNVTLGAHTWSHVNLAAIAREELMSELARPLHWLRGVQPGVAPWLAYPYGRWTWTVAGAAAAVGYVGAFCVDGGWQPKVPQQALWRLARPRLNVPAEVTRHGFRLRVAGVLQR